MDVLVILGSKSDADRGKKAVAVLEEFDVQTRLIVASAHRTPNRLRQAVEDSDAQIFIAMAGMSAALPGTVAALTILGLSMSGLSLLIHRGLYPRAQMGFTVVMLPTITILIRTLWDVAFGQRTEPQPNDAHEW